MGYHGYVTPEESRLDRIERNIEFLVENQAKHEAQLAVVTANIGRLATIAEMQIDASKDFDRRLSESEALHDREMAQVRLNLAEITGKLGALIKFVDDQNRRGKNGQH